MNKNCVHRLHLSPLSFHISRPCSVHIAPVQASPNEVPRMSLTCDMFILTQCLQQLTLRQAKFLRTTTERTPQAQVIFQKKKERKEMAKAIHTNPITTARLLVLEKFFSDKNFLNKPQDTEFERSFKNIQ